ncbi:helix-turn-helix domain-containing protein, partial [Enterococcus faecalis]
NLPIEDIAGKHGFNHYSRFIQLFKEAYGQTPKLIRKKYIGTSISNNETEEIKLDENVFKLIRNIEKGSNNTSIQCDIQFSAQDKQNCIFPYQLYIEMNKLMTLSHFDLLKLKNKLNYRSNEIHLIIDVDFELIMQNIK